ncbi:two-component system, chemotaxis family, sensor histidine kinase and response regulator WspE [Mariprofundus ferrinatatus]|uniref:Chemotaxis protein CheA n=1 Tax=Mariprofundus ferrinatatus TaxID=1921087 RepID=A0A2K8LCS7_9PROT|nr:hybrid sensor histidine kinase/response regulator [Mariprofundus ferrinatatus]ATX82704.1 two-component system, chemotaxis family, sensor histidine kinase and response regulator WspE [Mariprofundus ferrinatatus]
MSGDLSGFSMMELFRIETENQAAVLTEGLLELERDPTSAATLEALMRAAHSIKGAARIISLDGAVRIAHQMEDCFVAAQGREVTLGAADVDVLLSGVDMLSQISNLKEGDASAWFEGHAEAMDALVAAMAAILDGGSGDVGKQDSANRAVQKGDEEDEMTSVPEVKAAVREGRDGDGGREESKDRVLRLSSEHLDRMLALASEMQVGWQWLRPFSDSMLMLKRRLGELEKMLAGLEPAVTQADPSTGSYRIKSARSKAEQCRALLAEQQEELEMHSRSVSGLSHRLYHQTVASRMRPFGDGIPGFRRMVRDLAKDLGKKVRLDVSGLETTVDRDILEKIESPLNHLIRNAIDHGLESPVERRDQGKPEEGVIQLEAIHQSGMLRISVSDDGRGLDLDALRAKVIRNGHATKEMVDRMTESELMSFLFLPKFTMKESVTEISGRGVGLDIVASMVRDVRGNIHCTAQQGNGMRFELLLPITLSVVRSLLVNIAGEPYAFPLVHINRTLRCNRDEVERVEGHQFITLDGQQVGLASAREVLGLPGADSDGCYSIVVVGTMESRYGLIVDDFLGERDLVEKVLHPRLGKVKDISAAAVTADGSPLLIFDVSDLLRSVAKLVGDGKLGRASHGGASSKAVAKRILVVDDSLTVREVERKLLVSKGYEVEVAVDGMDGLNTVRSGAFDLVISDVDMPRMDGIEFVSHIKRDARLRDTPVIIVSYKESDEDRMRGLEAGADSYLTKSSFHDETLVETVEDLIGKAS